MNQGPGAPPWDETLRAIDDVLAREFHALSMLDADAVEKITAEKLGLEEKLRALLGTLPDRPDVRAGLSRVKAAALVNQALLVHARACLRGALQIATGTFSEPPAYTRNGGGPPPVRVNMRG